MALLMVDEDGKYIAECPLCGVALDDPIFSTSHFIGDPNHKLWRFSDAAMHRRCYVEWDYQSEFAQLYFEAKVESARTNDKWGIAYLDDLVLVTVNPDQFVAKVHIVLSKSGIGYRIDLEDWEGWLQTHWLDQCIDEFGRGTLSEIIPTLQSRIPTVKSLIEASGRDVNSKDSEPEGYVAQILREFAIRDLALRANTDGIACPHCGQFSTHYDYSEIESVSDGGPQSTLTCKSCGKAFGPEDRTVPT